MPLIDDRLSVGSIIFEFVHNTTPPKHKYYVIVGITDNNVALGTVYINSEINKYFHNKPDLLKLILPISASDYPFLRYDSHINCTDIQERSVADVKACIDNGGRHGYCATISPSELANILNALNNSPLIPVVKKKKYGIRK